VESLLFFAFGPLPACVCLWSMTSDSSRKLLDSTDEMQFKRFSQQIVTLAPMAAITFQVPPHSHFSVLCCLHFFKPNLSNTATFLS
jgi:hypothetical protein